MLLSSQNWLNFGYLQHGVDNFVSQFVFVVRRFVIGSIFLFLLSSQNWLNFGYLQHGVDNFVSQFVFVLLHFVIGSSFFVCDCLLFCLSGVLMCNSGCVIQGKECSVISLSG